MTEQWLMRPDGELGWWIDKAPDPDIQGQTIGPPVANVFFENHARLIKAAPNMLATLYFVRAHLTMLTADHKLGKDKYMIAAQKRIRAAIAKARGK